MSEPEPTTPQADALKADIEATRAQLARTADALAAKLDVKAQAGQKKQEVTQKAQEVGEKAADAYDSAKAAAPEPVQKAIGRVEQAAAPVAAKAGEDKKRTALLVAGSLATLLVIKRLRKRGG